MVLRRALAVFLALGVMSLPQVAMAREPGPTWESETTGSPVSTMQGRWAESEDGRTVELAFVGGHLIQPGTTFTARWLTPFTSKGKRARFENSYEIENINELGKDIELAESFRFRPKGEKWWPWIGFKSTLEPGSNYLGGGAWFGGATKHPVQFEWRLTGTIEAPTYLRGTATFSIN